MKVRTTHTLTPRAKLALEHHLGTTVTDETFKAWAQKVIADAIDSAGRAYDRDSTRGLPPR